MRTIAPAVQWKDDPRVRRALKEAQRYYRKRALKAWYRHLGPYGITVATVAVIGLFTCVGGFVYLVAVH